MKRWTIAQDEPGPVDHTWWSVIDNEARFVRVKAYGEFLAQSLADGLNDAEEEE